MSETFDFVIVGSGGGSLCAALLLQTAGKRVLVLEKTELVGGTTAISGGVLWIPNNRFMRAAGVEDSREKAIAYLDATVGDSGDTPGTSPARRRTYVDEAPAMIEFLVSQGIKLRRIPSWPDYYNAPGESVPGRTVVSELFDINQLGKQWKARLRPGFLPVAAYLEEAMEIPYLKRTKTAKKVFGKVLGRTIVSRLKGKHLATAGQALQGQMLHAALKAGVEIRINAAVKEIVVEARRVTGVVATINGSDQRISAKLGVLINAGGFSRNQRMLDQYIPGVSAEWTNTAPGDTGEMIEAGTRIGAAIAQMDQRVGSPCALPPEKPAMNPGMQGDVSKPHTIVVDQTGERYMRESSSYMEIAKAMLARNQQAPANPSWMIMDSQYLENYMLAGKMPGKKPNKRWIDEKFLLVGDSIEALAKACNIDPARLKASVDRFNGFVSKGRDEDFGRGSHAYDEWLGDALHTPSRTLGRIEKGPFYAVKIYPGDVSTYGGLVTDEFARVLREDGSVIDGLYATGTSTASVMGKATPGAGGSIGPSFTWGYVAAKHALQS
jgi:3-oxosteroid 1-dehydrogenase